MIPQNFIDEVQARTDIVELVSSYIPLKRMGRNYKALCPFHGEKTASFVVSSGKQIFHCFGCGEGGGVFQFLSLMEKVAFPEAVEILAKKLGLTVPYKGGQANKAKDILYEAAQEAAVFFNSNLTKNEDCQGIRDYLNKRGIGEKTISKFQIGYAYGKNTLLNYLRKKNFRLEALEKASLVTARRDGFADLFWERITFPIFDVRNRVIGFGARAHKEGANPKYLNSLENALYSKRNHLFGLNFSKDDIVKSGFVIVVEGYLDMITPFMRGVKNIVASLGTALTGEQIRLLKRYTNDIVLMYDSDKAGANATVRSIELILETGLKAEVAKMPPGYDPDSLAKEKGKDFFCKLLEERVDFFDYKLGSLKNTHDAASIGGKDKIAKELYVTINKLSSEIKKYGYLKKISDGLEIKEEIVIADFKNFVSQKNKSPAKGTLHESISNSIAKVPLSVTEKVLFKFMVTNPKAFALIKKNLKEEYFSSGLARKVIAFLFENYSSQQQLTTQNLLGAIADTEISGFISHILMDDDILMDKDSLKESLAKMREKGLTQLKKELKGRMKQAESQGDNEKVKELIKEYGRIK